MAIVDQKCGHLMKGDHKPTLYGANKAPSATKVDDAADRAICIMCGGRYYVARCGHCGGTGVEP